MVFDTDNKLGTFSNDVFIIADEMPAFNGKQIEEFRKFIAQNLRYTKEAQENSIQRRVYVQSTINSTGKLEYPKVVKSVYELLDKEALMVLNISP